ncbi:MAG TPA: cyclic nucleotide-binding domain-containing protein [Candidatus Dormibacteraeota bacterium]|nr:cyclic nucleotide-binding domain-containing protein [Candidatus Dormibacteraeota bacterium]
MADAKVEALSRVPLFSGCTPRELEFIAAHTDEVSVPAGKELTRQGALGHTFYVLLDGEVDVTIDGRHRTKLHAGDFFGEISMLDQGEGTATIVTTKPCRLMVMSHAQFRDVVKSHDGILVKVLEAMAARLRKDLTVAKQQPLA